MTVRINEFTPRSDVVDMEVLSITRVVFGLIDLTPGRLAAVVVTLKDSLTLSAPPRLAPLLSLPRHSLVL
ncbi:hypothetical protein [Halorubrum sp. AS12]|uniref:hypothetical protein n=1 Tax=Halorubrum sp. AS12 TaxID=3409687 RepID=UPI003DA76CA0